jgi:hypothetical protein
VETNEFQLKMLLPLSIEAGKKEKSKIGKKRMREKGSN